jgi:hypothetical protein
LIVTAVGSSLGFIIASAFVVKAWRAHQRKKNVPYPDRPVDTVPSGNRVSTSSQPVSTPRKGSELSVAEVNMILAATSSSNRTSIERVNSRMTHPINYANIPQHDPATGQPVAQYQTSQYGQTYVMVAPHAAHYPVASYVPANVQNVILQEAPVVYGSNSRVENYDDYDQENTSQRGEHVIMLGVGAQPSELHDQNQRLSDSNPRHRPQYPRSNSTWALQ